MCQAMVWQAGHWDTTCETHAKLLSLGPEPLKLGVLDLGMDVSGFSSSWKHTVLSRPIVEWGKTKTDAHLYFHS